MGKYFLSRAQDASGYLGSINFIVGFGTRTDGASGGRGGGWGVKMTWLALIIVCFTGISLSFYTTPTVYISLTSSTFTDRFFTKLRLRVSRGIKMSIANLPKKCVLAKHLI